MNARPLIDTSVLARRFDRRLLASGEFTCLVLKEARACFFVMFFMAALLALACGGVLGMLRYDVSSWLLLVIMTFVVVATLKDINARIHIAADSNGYPRFRRCAGLRRRAELP